MPTIAGLCIADKINIANNGLVDLARGWPEYWWVEAIPGQTSIPVVIVVEHEVEEDAAAIPLRILIAAGHQTLADVPISVNPVPRPGPLIAGAPHYRVLAMNVNYNVESVGRHEVRILDGVSGAMLADLRFAVVLKAP